MSESVLIAELTQWKRQALTCPWCGAQSPGPLLHQSHLALCPRGPYAASRAACLAVAAEVWEQRTAGKGPLQLSDQAADQVLQAVAGA